MNTNYLNDEVVQLTPITFDFVKFEDQYGKLWEVAIDTVVGCTPCHGTGFLYGPDGVEIACSSCEGLGNIETDKYYPPSKMATLWPLPKSIKINDSLREYLVNTTVVSLHDNLYLVSTNNVNDDVCDTYIRLGYLPPVSLISLLPLKKIANSRIIDTCYSAINIANDKNNELLESLKICKNNGKDDKKTAVMPLKRRSKLPVPEWLYAEPIKKHFYEDDDDE